MTMLKDGLSDAQSGAGSSDAASGAASGVVSARDIAEILADVVVPEPIDPRRALAAHAVPVRPGVVRPAAGAALLPLGRGRVWAFLRRLVVVPSPPALDDEHGQDQDQDGAAKDQELLREGHDRPR